MRKLPVFFIVLLALIIMTPVTALSVPASPDAAEVVQPDGTAVKVHLTGDEWNNWVETLDGYTVEKGPDGYWRYVVRYEDGKPVLSPLRADAPPPAGLQQYIRQAPDKRKTPVR
jgi:hypothetical protein